MHTVVVAHDGGFLTGVTTAQISTMLADPNKTVWLDITDADEQDVSVLRDEFGFHPLAIEDATRSHERPKVDAYESYYFVVFYAAEYETKLDNIRTQPVNLFIGSNYLVTVHSAEVREIGDTLSRWRAPNSPMGNRVSALTHDLLDALVDAYFPIMDQVADRVEELEDTIFIHFDQETIQTIFGLKKDLLGLRRVVAPERDVLNVLLRRQIPIFRAKDTFYLQDVYDHIVRVTDSIDTYRDLLSSALDSYLSLQSNNLNAIMKILTMASIVLMTGSLIAGIYGMNFKHMPELDQPWGYPAALGLIAVLGILLVVFFRRRKWW